MIDDRVVAHVARLSRLELSGEERARFRGQLADILGSFRQLLALDVSGMPPAEHAGAPADGAGTGAPGGGLRDDVPGPSLPRDEVLANAPAVEDGYFVVPPVIETE